MRNTFYLIYFIFILIVAGCSPEKNKASSLTGFIPENASITLKINDYQSFASDFKDNKIIAQLKSLPIGQNISKKLIPLQYVENQSEGLLTFIGTDENFDFTYISEDSLQFNFEHSPNKSLETLESGGKTFKKYQIDSLQFYTTQLFEKEILSSSLSVLEKLKENNRDNIKNEQLERLLNASDSTKTANLFIDFTKDDSIHKILLRDKESSQLLKFTDWISLDVEVDNEEILLNGVSVIGDSLANYLAIFKDAVNKPGRSKFYAPKNASSYKTYTLPNHKIFDFNRQEYLNIDIQRDSLFATVEEVGIASIKNEKIVFLHTYGAANIMDFLKSVQKNTTDFQGSEIMELNESNFLNQHFNPLLLDFKSNFTCILENTLIFSERKKTLENVIRDYKSGNVFEKSKIFSTANRIVTNQSTILTIENGNGFKESLSTIISPDFSSSFDITDFKEFVFGSQFVSEGDFMLTTFFIKKISDENKSNTVSPIFKIELDADIATKPQFVINHRTNKKEIVVQDEDNVLYLISTKGKVLWKKQLDSRIQGRIQQVDIYKNKRLQLAFTTNNQFLILDRNGKEVSPFNKKYDGGNLNPLAVFDYENNKNYRFVVTQNDKVFMYDGKARIVSGFKYTKAEASILKAPQHFKIGKKDYLIFQLEGNKLKILNRVGDVRIKTKEIIPFSENDLRLYKNTIAFTTTNGQLFQIATNGTVKKTDLNLNKDHGMDATSKTLAIMDDNILRVRDKKVALELGVYTNPAIFYLNDKIYVSVTDIQNQKSYLFDSQTKTIPGFPIYGISTIDMVDMDNDKKPELVIQDQENSFTVYKIR
ncbi:ribonuclease HII [Maribacter sp. 2210JD10-5]|uniref:ribonuclease HII n=1 Tax=Maribacter sp. 2210JD10-5 TaxID=3386272 RepID=UPI0039BD1F6B